MGGVWDRDDVNPEDKHSHLVEFTEPVESRVTPMEVLNELTMNVLPSTKDIELFHFRLTAFRYRLDVSDFYMSEKAYVWFAIKSIEPEYPEHFRRCGTRLKKGKLTWTDFMVSLYGLDRDGCCENMRVED